MNNQRHMMKKFLESSVLMKITAPFAVSFQGCERKTILVKQTEEKNDRKANEKQGAELKLPVRDDGGSVPLFKRLTQAAC